MENLKIFKERVINNNNLVDDLNNDEQPDMDFYHRYSIYFKITAVLGIFPLSRNKEGKILWKN